MLDSPSNNDSNWKVMISIMAISVVIAIALVLMAVYILYLKLGMSRISESQENRTYPRTEDVIELQNLVRQITYDRLNSFGLVIEEPANYISSSPNDY